ncbi:hypothetical protein DFJ77DRAFT_266460 [Powellomyces hirtus]|nr:hypothetical protein DFJ77DRAFT_266460 [Powellomyces hirtus]
MSQLDIPLEATTPQADIKLQPVKEANAIGGFSLATRARETPGVAALMHPVNPIAFLRLFTIPVIAAAGVTGAFHEFGAMAVLIILAAVLFLCPMLCPYKYECITFGELNEKAMQAARVFRKHGVTRGDKVLFAVPPSPEMLACFFGLIEVIGAVPVLINPLIGRKPFLNAVRSSKAQYMVSRPLVNFAAMIMRSPFASVKTKFSSSSFSLSTSIWGHPCFHKNKAAVDVEADFGQQGSFAPADALLIVYTSGSTGHPKPVVFTHGMMAGQRKALMTLFPPGQTGIIAVVPWLILSVGMGMTAVLPPFNISRPASGKPEDILSVLRAIPSTSTLIASGVVWRRLAEHCAAKKIVLPPNFGGMTGGTALSLKAFRLMREAMGGDGKKLVCAYGSTEGQPLCFVDGDQILSDDATAKILAGKGMCSGVIAPGCQMKFIKDELGPLERMSGDIEVGLGDIGEIVLAGETISPRYEDEKANAYTKIADDTLETTSKVWHRTGDLGRLDVESGMVYFCGRKAHMILVQNPTSTTKTKLYSVPLEAVMELHPAVQRAALVGVKLTHLGAETREIPVVLIMPQADIKWTADLERELLSVTRRVPGLDNNYPYACIERVLPYLKKGGFPTDATHNTKIRRELLSKELEHWKEFTTMTVAAPLKCNPIAHESTLKATSSPLLAPIAPENFSSAVDCFIDALADDPVTRYVYDPLGADTTAIYRAKHHVYSFGCRASMMVAPVSTVCYEPSSSSDSSDQTPSAGSLVAASLWFPPGVQADDTNVVIKAQGYKLPSQVGLAVAKRMMVDVAGSIETAKKQVLKEYGCSAYWHLVLLGTLPGKQGQGYGSRLLADRCNAVDAVDGGQWMYLECSKKENVPFYEKHGFVLAKTVFVDKAKTVALYLMVRPPISETLRKSSYVAVDMSEVIKKD